MIWRDSAATIGKFRLGLTAVEKPLAKSPVPDDVLQALRVAPEKRDDKQRRQGQHDPGAARPSVHSRHE